VVVRPALIAQILPPGSGFVVRAVLQQVWPRARCHLAVHDRLRRGSSRFLGDLPLGVFFVRRRDLAGDLPARSIRGAPAVSVDQYSGLWV
jgi:hypothetical protein